MLNSKWFLEYTTYEEGSFHSLKEIIYAGSSNYQRIEIIQTGSYGKCLVLDGKIQSTIADEFIYHEALVHPALTIHKSPKRVLICGGGEGATAREALKHPDISEVFIVDLDREVVELSKQYLKEWHKGAYDDRRVKLFYEDARGFIERYDNFFDVMILDLPEPFEGGPALLLYTKEFYRKAYKCLNKDGVMVTQAASCAVNNMNVFTAIVNTIKQIFPVVMPYTANIPSFHSPWGFCLASKDKKHSTVSTEIIKKRLINLKGELRFYDESTHVGMFSLPKYLRKAIENETAVITDSSPVSFY